MSHLQGEDGGHRFVVTGCVLHVTPVAVLCHFGPAGQPWSGAALPCVQGSVGRCGGPQAPQDPVGPSRFTLFPAARRTEKHKREKRKWTKSLFYASHPAGKNLQGKGAELRQLGSVAHQFPEGHNFTNLVSYVSVPTSNLYVGGNFSGPSWKPSNTVSLSFAMLSCKNQNIYLTSHCLGAFSGM